MHRREKNAYNFFVGKPERDHLEYEGIYGSIILKQILNRIEGVGCTLLAQDGVLWAPWPLQ
jgi:hypothetical protein